MRRTNTEDRATGRRGATTMNLLVLLLLATATARVDAVNLTTVESQLAVRVALSGQPGMVAVHREGEGARVSISDVELGGAFAGGTRFAWTPANGFDPALLSAPARLDRIEVTATPGEVSVLLRVPPEISIDVRRYRNGLLLVLREASATPPPATVARAAPPPPLSAEPAPAPEPAPEPPAPVETATPAPPPVASTPEPSPAPEAPKPEPEPPILAAQAAPPSPPPAPQSTAAAPDTPPASRDTAELARGLFPAAAVSSSSAAGSTSDDSVNDLYAQLFPGGAPQTDAETVEPSVEPWRRPRACRSARSGSGSRVDVRYVDADTFVDGPDEPARDRYLEVVPRLIGRGPGGRRSLRARVRAGLPGLRHVRRGQHQQPPRERRDRPAGRAERAALRSQDTFVSGTLDTREVDPGRRVLLRPRALPPEHRRRRARASSWGRA